MTPIPYPVSPSQIETFRLCKRKWAWQKIAGLESKTSVAAEKGQHVHKMLEAWLKNSTTIDLNLTVTLSDGSKFNPGPVAAGGLRHLPSPSDVTGVERPITLARARGQLTNPWHYHGYSDFTFLIMEKKGRTFSGVGDHKTTTDLKWAKNEVDLRKDPQVLIYGAFFHDQQPALVRSLGEMYSPVMTFLWVYYQSRAPFDSEKRKFHLSIAEIETALLPIDETAQEIADTFTALTHVDADATKEALVKSLPPTISACEAYGGCAFKASCAISNTEKLSAIFTQESLVKKLKQKEEEKQMATTEEQEQTLAQRLVARKLQNQKEGNALQPAPAAPALTPTTPTAGVKEPTLLEKLAAQKAAAADKQAPAEPAPAVPNADAPAETRVATAEPLKVRKARVAKAAPAPEDSDLPGTVGALQTNPALPVGRILYINCMPGTGVSATMLSDLIDVALGGVRASTGGHYRLIEYGKGPSVLQDVFAPILEAHDGGIYCDARSQETIDVLPVLERWASVVVRGF